MSVLIGDLMAVADDGYGAGGRKKKSRRRGGGKKEMKAGSGCESGPLPAIPTSRKEREKWGTQNPSERKSLRTQGRLPPKRMGELSELDFLRKTMGMGMIVSKPWGDSYRYDFVCDTSGRLWRVQVRSTDERFGHRGYAVHASVYVGRKIVGLTEKDIDVIVAYIVPRDIWYVVPVKAFVPRKNLWFYPDGSKKGAMFEKYREAWWVMMGRKKK
jgi:PD-(D/E)XK endonuclease